MDQIRHLPSGAVLLALIISGMAVLSVWAYFFFKRQVRRTAEWIKKVRLGQELPLPKRSDGFLTPLTIDVAKMARSLATARSAAQQEARLRQHSESVWTAERLKEYVKTKLNGHPMFVVSNREPYRHVWKNKKIECVVPASGLVTAIEPVLKACGGTWIAEGDGDADKQTVDKDDKLRVPPEEPQYTLKRIWLGPKELKGYYYGFANEGLWPLCHIAHTRPTFRVSDWMYYRSVNKKFAEAVLREVEHVETPHIMVQDYHFALLPKLIKQERPDARVTLFWHIPWPNPESFGICPWGKDLLSGMLGADTVGFHTQFHCNNFLETVDRFLESRIDYERFSVHCEGRTSWVKPFPISIAFSDDALSDPGERPAALSPQEFLKPYGITAKKVGIGVDRLDYTKGILERFRGIEHFLEKNPYYRGRFTFIQLAAPSRELISKYQQFGAEVEREAERINARFSVKHWKAILLLKKHHSHAEIAPLYKFADLCMVTSLHDGMNLVAKEFVAARSDEKGVLILSQFTGASRELTEALTVNPYDTAQVADAIEQALEMPDIEQTERMQHMRGVVKDRNIYRWAADLVGELAQVRTTNNSGQKHETSLARVA